MKSSPAMPLITFQDFGDLCLGNKVHFDVDLEKQTFHLGPHAYDCSKSDIQSGFYAVLMSIIKKWAKEEEAKLESK